MLFIVVLFVFSTRHCGLDPQSPVNEFSYFVLISVIRGQY
jgi:uncharacterized membrane protein